MEKFFIAKGNDPKIYCRMLNLDSASGEQIVEKLIFPEEIETACTADDFWNNLFENCGTWFCDSFDKNYAEAKAEYEADADFEGCNENSRLQMEKFAEMAALCRKLNDASDLYYGGSMPNHEWDALFDELEALEDEAGFVLDISPTNKVNASNNETKFRIGEFRAVFN